MCRTSNRASKSTARPTAEQRRDSTTAVPTAVRTVALTAVRMAALTAVRTAALMVALTAVLMVAPTAAQPERSRR